MQKKICLTSKVNITLLIIVGICLGGWLIVKEIIISPQRKALPATAEEIHEWSWHESGLLVQDHFYMLTAKISEQEFNEYVSSLDMVLYTAQNDVPIPSWYSFERHTNETYYWWKPTESIVRTYVYISKGYWEYAKYENGCLYMYSFNI